MAANTNSTVGTANNAGAATTINETIDHNQALHTKLVNDVLTTMIHKNNNNSVSLDNIIKRYKKSVLDNQICCYCYIRYYFY